MRRTHIRRLPELAWLQREEPSVGYCTCTDPDIRPIGGWWPSSFTCCHACAKPPRP